LPESEFLRLLYGQHGIDGLFLHATPPPKYFIAEMKYHKSTYGWTKDGKQMSDPWIRAKLKKQVSPKLLKDILLNGYEKSGLRYLPDLDRMILEGISW
jgi:hypothetical protein